MKTVFISSFHGFIARNILSTDALRVLGLKSDLRIVIFVPYHKERYFKECFEKENVIVEGVNTDMHAPCEKLFSWLASSIIDTVSLRLHKEAQLLKTKNYPRYIAARTLAILFGKTRRIKKLIRFFDYTLMDKGRFKEYFKKYNPNLVFMTDMFLKNDLELLASAKSRKVRTVGMIRSWDNITNKGLMRLTPDKLLVNNEFIKKEAVLYQALSPESITVIGMPQFDEYIIGTRSSREEFFKEIGGDPKKRLAVFAPYGNRFHDTDWQVLQILKESKASGLIPSDIQFFVRFPPGDDVALCGFIATKDFIIDKPGVPFKKGVPSDKVMSQKDSTRLADAIFHSEVIIAYASTIAIDAAIFDKPVILTMFDGWEQRPYFKSVKRFYDYDHMEPIMKGNCCKTAKSKSDLIFWINKYLEDPSIDREGRRKLVQDQLCYVDGRSGERIAKFLYENLLLN